MIDSCRSCPTVWINAFVAEKKSKRARKETPSHVNYLFLVHVEPQKNPIKTVLKFPDVFTYFFPLRLFWLKLTKIFKWNAGEAKTQKCHIIYFMPFL